MGWLKGNKGYTLIEVAVVVAITSTLAAVVIPVVIDKIGTAHNQRIISEHLINTVPGTFNQGRKQTHLRNGQN